MNSTSRPVDFANTEALATLAEYLERSLDEGKSLILVRSHPGTSDVYLADASEPLEGCRPCGVIPNALVSTALGITNSGLNILSIGGQTYRFVRTFTQLADHGAVVFTAA